METIDKGHRSIQGIRAAIFEGKIWIFDRRVNALFSMDIETEKVEYVLSIEEEPKYQQGLISHIVYYDNKIFLNPALAGSGVLVDMKTMTQKKILFNRKEKFKGVKNSNVIQKDSIIYMLPKCYGEGILIYNFIDNKISKVPIDYRFATENQLNISEFCWGSGCRTKNGYCLIIASTPGILYLKDSGKWKYYKVDTLNEGFGNCIVYDNDIYLLPYKGKDIMVFHTKSEKFDKVILPKEITCKGDVPYAAITIIKDKLVLFPADEENIVICDLKTQETILYYIGSNRFYDCKVYGDKIYGFPYIGEDIIVININTNKIRKINLHFPNSYKENNFLDYWLYQVPCLEQEKYLHCENIIPMEYFIKNIVSYPINNIGKEKNNNGSIIWESILMNRVGE